MYKSTKVRSMTVEISYPNPDTISDSFRVYLCKSTKGKWLSTILLVSRGDANPINYFSDTYSGLAEFLSDEGLDITELTIYVDLMEYYGLNSQFLYRWDIKNITKPIRSQIETVNPSQLSEIDKLVLDSYYSNKWSIFTESCLTNEDKVHLLANALANTVYDDYEVESVQSSIGFELDEAVRRGTRINRIHEYLK